MNLCIDIGNTRVKFAVFDAAANLIDLVLHPTLEQDVIQRLLSQYAVTAVILSSVRADHQEIRTWLATQLQAVYWLDAQLEVPILNHYLTPQTLGKDRLAAVVGAVALYPHQNILVVDAGTCITYDFVDEQRNYWGGSILPGLQMRLDAMTHFTAKLPALQLEVPKDWVGNTTISAMQTGAFWGVLHELEGFKHQYSAKYGAITLVITGGDSTYFESQLKNEIFAQPNLVLIGLNTILEYNEGL